ncbi:acetyltransferase (GNAT) family protein [Harryflintia acetispora]|uniref:Acetyltransferase (GNAT) family protein n=2 Tax=Harryflintia acetispora TaxID=1849041 RepID=A0A9X8UIY3_9FIRM|nr:acetyltransferase (GNAT) family protein [Harryflintia acetispora]
MTTGGLRPAFFKGDSMGEIVIRSLGVRDCVPGLLQSFERYQQVTRVWRTVGGEQRIVDCPFTEHWSGEEKDELVINTLLPALQAGGALYVAYDGETVAGFALLEGVPAGSRGQYRILAELYTSYPYRGRGIGRRLFLRCAGRTREMGGQYLYISAHSAVESMAFYRAMGCVAAGEVNQRLAEKEPCDCQLECRI